MEGRKAHLAAGHKVRVPLEDEKVARQPRAVLREKRLRHLGRGDHGEIGARSPARVSGGDQAEMRRRRGGDRAEIGTGPLETLVGDRGGPTMELGRSDEIASLGRSELRGAARRLHARNDQLERQDLRGAE